MIFFNGIIVQQRADLNTKLRTAAAFDFCNALNRRFGFSILQNIYIAI